MSADAVELSLEELRSLAGWAAGWAAAVLPRFEQAVPGDGRPRAAIEAATAFAAGAPRSQALRIAALDAYRAARETAEAAASHAASAASAAAGSAFLHPIARATQVRHVLGAPAHAVLASGATADALQSIRASAPAAVVALLRRYPAAPDGDGRTGEVLRALDALLRS